MPNTTLTWPDAGVLEAIFSAPDNGLVTRFACIPGSLPSDRSKIFGYYVTPGASENSFVVPDSYTRCDTYCSYCDDPNYPTLPLPTELVDWLNRILEGRVVVDGFTVPGHPEYADGENSEDVECSGCHASILPGESRFGSQSNVCEDCWHVCEYCEKGFNLNNGHRHAVFEDEIWCAACTRDNTILCVYCENWCLQDDCFYVVHDGHACNDCAERYTFYCEECDEYHHNESGHSHRPHHIEDYSYKPFPVFHHTDEELESAPVHIASSGNTLRKYRSLTYMGFELEVEADYDNLDDGAEVFGPPNDIHYLKQDGSLNDGFEIVTHPMTLAWARDNFPWDKLDRLNQMGFGAWEAPTTGLHVHVSRDAFSNDSHQGKFIMFFLTNRTAMETLAGRSNSRWSSFARSEYSHLSRKIKGREYSNRYVVVNMSNRATLEVRMFRSSLSKRRILMAMGLVDAVVAYTDTITVGQAVSGNALDWSKFVAWLRANEATYPELVAYCDLFTDSTGAALATEIGE